MKSKDNQVKKGAQTAGKKVKEAEMQGVKEAFSQAAKQSALPSHLLGISDEALESIYAQAFRLYNTGGYVNATKLFRMLTSIRPNEPKYLMGLAASFHMRKEYKAAASVYMILSLVDVDSPLPYYHASDCYINMNDIPSAIVMLEMAIDRSKDHKEFATLKDRAILTRDGLKKELTDVLSNKGG